MAPNPDKIAQKTMFLPAFGVWVGYRSSGSRARRGDYKRNSDIKALKRTGFIIHGSTSGGGRGG